MSIKNLLKDTRDQSYSEKWHLTRQNMITASNFSRICRARAGYTNIVKNILYPSLAGVEAIKFGRDNEQIAIKKLEKEADVKIHGCGLFIDEYKFYLGVTPDGIIDQDGCVEVKCSFKNAHMSAKNAILARLIDYIKVNKDNNEIVGLKPTHRYYYQIQEQLAISQKNYCLFAIFTNEKEDFVQAMMIKLDNFFHMCLLPEIVDSKLIFEFEFVLCNTFLILMYITLYLFCTDMKTPKFF